MWTQLYSTYRGLSENIFKCISFKISLRQYVSNGSFNGLVENWWRSIILTNESLVYWPIYVVTRSRNYDIICGVLKELEPTSIDNLSSVPDKKHYSDVIMSMLASQITGVSIVCSTVCAGADQRKQQSSASLGFVMGIHQWLVGSPHRGPVMRTMISFDDIIINTLYLTLTCIPHFGIFSCHIAGVITR